MDIIKFSIKKPVTVFMCICVAIILGFVSLNKMPLELMSSMNIPVATVMATYSGAGPEEVESLVTEPIESALASVKGIDTISSSSSEGTAIIIVKFDYGTDMDQAISDMRDKISMIQRTLPSEVDTPTVLKLDMDSSSVANIAITSDSLSQNELKALVEDKIQPRLERQSGVASASLSGGKEKEITVEIEPEKMQGLGLSMSQIAGILSAENVNQSGGTIDYGEKSLTISSKLKMLSIDDVKATPIPLSSGAVVQLQEIATISEVDKEVTSISRYNGQDCITLSITKSSDGNTVSVVNAVKKEVEKLSKEYKEINIAVTYETGSIIQNSVNNVLENIMIGAVLAIIVLFIFLKNVGLTAIIAISMPISIVITLVLLYFCGISLNMISLGGLSIGVGMLVDNSVVVIENIYRYRTAEGYNKIKGTYRATKEMLTSVFGSTLTSIVIFLPFLFTNGMVKEMFMPLALSVVFSLVASLVSAITVVPMISGNFVNNVHRNHAPKLLGFINILLDLFDKFIQGLNKFYGKLLAVVIKARKRTLLVVIAAFIGSLMLLGSIGMELIPSSDEGTISVTLEAPKGSQLSVINDLSAKAEKIIEAIPELDNLSVSITGNADDNMLNQLMGTSGKSNISIELVDKTKRSRSSDEIAEDLRNQLSQIAGADITVSASSTMSSLSSSGIEIEIHGDDEATLKDISNEIERQLAQIKGTRQITSSLSDQNQQIALHLDKNKIRQYGLTGTEVTSQIRNTVNGQVATKLKNNGTETDIRLIYPATSYATLNNLGNISIKTNTGTYVPLSSLGSFEMTGTQSAITRSDQTRYVTVKCDVFGRDLGSISKDVSSLLSQMNFPTGYTVNLGGTTETMNDTFSQLILVIILAVILVYAVMAAQFESFINPFIIMFTIPLAFSGAFLLLFLLGEPLSIISMLGMLVLVGIVVNNGIVLIDYINTLRDRDHYSLEDAVLKACPTRLRPILMTALTTILGQIPVIISQGENSEMLKGMGIVIAGGLTTSTLLTLIVVPILYMQFDKLSNGFRHLFKLKPKKNSYEVDDECC